jgi:type IV pilus assembly protein PilC
MELVKFIYEGTTVDGKRVKGEVEARDERALRRVLRRKNIKVKKVTRPKAAEQDIGQLLVDKGIVKGFGNQELLRFTKQLSTLVNAGVPIVESLDILWQQERNLAFRAAVKQISHDVSEGKTLNEALAEHEGFDRLYCSLVKAGETGGILDTILEKLANVMEKREEVRKKIKKAMTYPSIVIVVGIGVVTGLMVFVVPQFVGMLQESGQEIPAVTQLVIDVSDFMSSYFFHLMAGLFIGYIVFNKWKKTKAGKKSWDRFVMKSPVFGVIIIKGTLASFTRTLSTMLGSGVPIIDALDICGQTIDNFQIQRDVKFIKEAVVNGRSITDPIRRIKYFPPLVNQMMKVGESTGNLDQMLVKVADVFEQETEDAIDTMTSLIEPMILVVLGGIIGTVLIAMYLPIFMSAGGA